MLTKAKLRRFVTRRNRSSFRSNLQFMIDAQAEGFEVDTLGTPIPFMIDGFKGYKWRPTTTDGGALDLVEFGHRLYLETNRDDDSAHMFHLMKKAVYEPVIDKPIDKSGLTGL